MIGMSLEPDKPLQTGLFPILHPSGTPGSEFEMFHVEHFLTPLGRFFSDIPTVHGAIHPIFDNRVFPADSGTSRFCMTIDSGCGGYGKILAKHVETSGYPGNNVIR